MSATAYETRHLEISNERVRLILPDPTLATPYYQAHRFTQPGMVIAAEWKGIPIFQEIGEPRDPGMHNHVGGTAEEFDINGPADYKATPVGGAFMKIGVGMLQRVKDVPYRFSHTYPMVQVPINEVEKVNQQTLKFIQTLRDSEGARSYQLVIVVRVVDDGFVIDRQVYNLGTTPIETEHYSHNFSLIAGKHVDSDYKVHWTSPVSYKEKLGDEATASPTGITFSKTPSDRFYFASEPGINFPANEAITLSHVSAGVTISIAIDRPLHRIAIFGRADVICPEPFVVLSVPPGENVSWSTSYTFAD